MAQWAPGLRTAAPSAGRYTPLCFLDVAGQRFRQISNPQKPEFLSSSPDYSGILYRTSCMRLQALTIGDEQIEEGDLMNTERCICCGTTIPEGRQICYNCENPINTSKNKAPQRKGFLDTVRQAFVNLVRVLKS